jgi:hypothetical protein
MEDSIPEKQRILKLVEVKSCPGGSYDDIHIQEVGYTIDKWKRQVWRMYKGSNILLKPNFKDINDHGSYKRTTHHDSHSLGNFDKDSTQ